MAHIFRNNLLLIAGVAAVCGGVYLTEYLDEQVFFEEGRNSSTSTTETGLIMPFETLTTTRSEITTTTETTFTTTETTTTVTTTTTTTVTTEITTTDSLKNDETTIDIDPYEEGTEYFYCNTEYDETLETSYEKTIFIANAIDNEAAFGDINDAYGVGSVIMNRVNHWAFPGTVREVLLQEGQYPWADEYTIEYVPSEWAYNIAEDIVVNGHRTMPENVVFQAQFQQGSGIYTIIGVHYYCIL